MKEVADDGFKFDENGRNFSKWVENTVEKGEIARHKQILLFPKCFRKTCSVDIKTRAFNYGKELNVAQIMEFSCECVGNIVENVWEKCWFVEIQIFIVNSQKFKLTHCKLLS